MFPAALLVVAKRWEQPRGPSTDEGNHRIWTGHRREEYSALKRKEILTHVRMQTLVVT